MARKSSKSSKSKSRTRKKPTSKARSRKSGARRSRASQPRSASRGGLSLDRKLDIAGVILSLVGLLTLLSLLSTNRSTWVGGWVNVLQSAFGWGIYLLPLVLIAVGLWLVLRNFERIPGVSLERLLGFVLLYANLLAWLHFSHLPPSREAVFQLASQGAGGGYTGGIILEALRAALGIGGAAIALLAWLLIALALSLDTSVVELFRWVSPLADRLARIVRQVWALAAAQFARLRREVDTLPGFIPLPQDPDLLAPAQPNLQASPGNSNFQNDLTPSEGAAKTWVLPSVDEILDQGGEVSYDDEYDRHRARVIEETLASFGAPANVVEINRGPTITQFGVEPDFIETRNGRTRVRVSKISSLADDLALALAARTIRIQAPVPGRGYVGVEVPNDEISLVALRDVIESEAFRRMESSLSFALGQDVAGNAVAADLAIMPHLLIAGATGSGKSVCINSLISCLLLHNTPNDLRMIMVDPKRVELTNYNGIPHLLAPVVVELERVVGALQWVTREMDQRYHKLAQAGTRNIDEYNAKLEASGQKKLPNLVVIIDELADLMMLAPDETERTVTRLAQLARATGIHLVIATQRPSVDVVTGLIKANFPARIAFAVASGVDSRVILDQPGAERLLGRGDMLFQAPDAAAPVRLQGSHVTDNEIFQLVSYWRSFVGITETAPSDYHGVVDAPPPNIPLKQLAMWEEMVPEEEMDPLLEESIDLIRRQGRASISMLQRRLRIGYTRAARLIETIEEKGIIGPPETGTGAREVLDYGPAAPPADE
jgi:S-DNA-T family DNA segregation ATPase FtsK/SpoIIIE